MEQDLVDGTDAGIRDRGRVLGLCDHTKSRKGSEKTVLLRMYEHFCGVEVVKIDDADPVVTGHNCIYGTIPNFYYIFISLRGHIRKDQVVKL